MLRQAVRRLRAAPAFSATAVALLAMSIGAAASIGGLLEAVVLRPLPFRDADRLVWIWHALHGDFELSLLARAAAITVGVAVVIVFGAWLSWRAWRVAATEQELVGQEGGRPRAFLALSSTIIALLFATVIATQGAAGLILSGCER